MAGNKPILMSRENRDGHKLEELLAQIADELTKKNDRLTGDLTPAAQTLRHNNVEIISLMHQARRHQEHSLKVLLEVGPDQGPMGKPRVGQGS